MVNQLRVLRCMGCASSVTLNITLRCSDDKPVAAVLSRGLRRGHRPELLTFGTLHLAFASADEVEVQRSGLGARRA